MTIRSRIADIINECLQIQTPQGRELLYGDGDRAIGALEDRLKQVLANSENLPTVDLMTYLRITYTKRQMLQTWGPLLARAKQLCQQRGENDGIFVGLQ